MNHKVKLSFIGIQNQFNQCWFRARHDSTPYAIKRRKRWGNLLNDKREWDYESPLNATRFADEADAVQVYERLKAEMPGVPWAVVRFEKVESIRLKTIFEAKKGTKQ